MKDETKLEIIKELAKGNVKIAQLILEVQGDNNYYENRNKDEKMKLSDEQISKAIISICGDKKPLNEKQLYLGVICVLISKYGWTGKFSACCARINSLPMKDEFEKSCDYNSIKILTALKFASVDYKEWSTYEPRDSERGVFRKCKAVAEKCREKFLSREPSLTRWKNLTNLYRSMP